MEGGVTGVRCKLVHKWQRLGGAVFASNAQHRTAQYLQAR